MKTFSSNQIIKYFSTDNKESYSYLQFHSRRYEFLLKILDKHIKKCKNKEKLNLLDIGPNYQTKLILKLFDNLVIDTLGIHKSYEVPRTLKHIIFDLNDCLYNKIPANKKYNLVVMAEVLEHLYVPPEVVLSCIKDLLKAGGYLVLQTPNAVVLGKRIKMLLGYNPQEKFERAMDGHFREYTLSELIEEGKKAGFSVEEYYFKDYFNPSPVFFDIFKSPPAFFDISRKLAKLFPTFRGGITIIYKKV